MLLIGVLSSCSVTQRINKADKKFALGEYYRAAEMYRAVYPQVSSSKQKKLKGEVAFKMGNAYKLIGNNKRAEAAFKNAVRYKAADTLVYLNYASVLQASGKYTEALKMYKQHLEIVPGDMLAISGIASCDSALTVWKKQSKYTVEKEKKFQSKKFSEFCPLIASSDGDVVYFNSTRGGKKVKTSQITGQRNNDVYYSRRNIKGEFSDPELLEGDINTEFDEGTCALSADGQELFFTRSNVVKGETRGTSIYLSKRSGGAWSEPKELKILKDSSLNVAHPALSIDGEYLYFVSDMPGTLGGKDLWRAKREGDENFTNIENLGPSINTEGDEVFPSFRDNGVLYFSSSGHPGLGGLDIFCATLADSIAPGEKLSWNVSRIESPINSNADDFGITFEKGKDRGYFSSNRGDRRFYDHIYRFEKPEVIFQVSGTITDEKGDIIPDAVVRMIGNNGSNEKIRAKKNGTYEAKLSADTKYVMMALCRGYLNKKAELVVPNQDVSESFLQDFTLTSINKPVKMDNIFFDFGSASLTKESTVELDKLVTLLTDNPNITIEIGAHTDIIGSEETNLVLSKARAKSVVDYLVSKGIESDRLTAVGYGKSQPIVPDKALVRKYRYFKVGVPLNEDYIKKLNTEQQEVANSLNRRTEFKVLKTTYKMY